ncbi:MAG: PAS domain S-box protein [Gammaproteobacteria bacterium]|nr:PAS domain S-box protein [Gammaproteobacteria bacterium]
MENNDPIVRLYRRGINSTLLGLTLVAGIIGAVAIAPFYQNLRNQSLEQFQRFGTSLADQLHSRLIGMTGLAEQITSRTRARNLLIEHNQGKLARDEASRQISDILSDVPQHSPEVLAVWRFDQQGQLLAGVGLQLPKSLPQGPPWSQTQLQLHSLRQTQQRAEGPPLLLADAPIHDREQHWVGNDLVLFSSQGLINTLTQASAQYPHASIRLQQQGQTLVSLGASQPSADLAQFDRSLGSSGLQLELQMPFSELYREAEQHAWRLALALLMLMLIGGIGLFLLSRRILQGLHEQMALRQQREQDLLASEQRFRGLVQHSPLPMLVVDDGEEGHIGLINRSFSELFGYREGELRRLQDWWRLAYPNEAERLQAEAEWRQTLPNASSDGGWGSGRFGPVTREIRCADGSLRFVELSLSRLYGFGLEVFSDLTAQRQRSGSCNWAPAYSPMSARA